MALALLTARAANGSTAMPSPSHSTSIPQAPGFDSTVALIRDPYRFISTTCGRLGSDCFATRLLLKPTICLRGAEAAALFYTSPQVMRTGAAPRRIQKTLVGQGGVQGLDDAAHQHRKRMFLDILSAERVQDLAHLVQSAWPLVTATLDARPPLELYRACRELLMRAVCTWAEIPLTEAELPRRTREVAALFDYAGSIGPRHWWARHARTRCERWLADLITEVRAGYRRPTPRSALHRIAMHHDLAGDPLPTRIAAVELLNVIRPTVAVAVYLVQAAHALHEHPAARTAIRAASAAGTAYTVWFVQEVRRWYPFFPAAIAKVRNPFTWRDYTFPAGWRLLLDLYGTNHDPATWGDPEDFRPERFRDWSDDGFAFIPQGGGDAAVSHRCPGEPLAIELMRVTCEHLAHAHYSVPAQDLRLDYSRLPALPRSRFLISA